MPYAVRKTYDYPMHKLKIIIAEDHIRYRKAIVALLNSDQRFEVIGEAESGEQVVRLTTNLQPDIVIMDVKLEGQNGIDATRDIKRKMPNVNVIGLSLYDEEEQQALMLQFGASAYLNKKSSIEEIKSTIIRVQQQFQYQYISVTQQ